MQHDLEAAAAAAKKQMVFPRLELDGHQTIVEARLPGFKLILRAVAVADARSPVDIDHIVAHALEQKERGLQPGDTEMDPAAAQGGIAEPACAVRRDRLPAAVPLPGGQRVAGHGRDFFAGGDEGLNRIGGDHGAALVIGQAAGQAVAQLQILPGLRKKRARQQGDQEDDEQAFHAISSWFDEQVVELKCCNKLQPVRRGSGASAGGRPIPSPLRPPPSFYRSGEAAAR